MAAIKPLWYFPIIPKSFLSNSNWNRQLMRNARIITPPQVSLYFCDPLYFTYFQRISEYPPVKFTFKGYHNSPFSGPLQKYPSDCNYLLKSLWCFQFSEAIRIHIYGTSRNSFFQVHMLKAIMVLKEKTQQLPIQIRSINLLVSTAAF